MNKEELVETRILENGGETFDLLLSSKELEQHSSDYSFLQLVIIFGTGLIFLLLHRYMGIKIKYPKATNRPFYRYGGHIE